MRDDYVLKGSTIKLEVELEKEVAEKLSVMENFAKLSKAEIVNTALKRFIAGHKDFLPQQHQRKS